MPRSLAILATAGALALGVAACGGSSSASSSAAGSAPPATTASTSSATPAPSGRAAKLTIMAMSNGDLMFTRKHYSVKAGTVDITFQNSSGEGHNLYLQRGTDGKVLGSTPTIDNGSKSFTVTLTPGTYTYYCNVPGHRQAGMFGTLTVS